MIVLVFTGGTISMRHDPSAGGAGSFGVVGGFVGCAVEDAGDGQAVLGVGVADARARAAVAERAWRGVLSKTVGYGIDAVLVGLQDEAEPPVHDVLEGLVEHADAVVRGDCLDRLRREDSHGSG